MTVSAESVTRTKLHHPTHFYMVFAFLACTSAMNDTNGLKSKAILFGRKSTSLTQFEITLSEKVPCISCELTVELNLSYVPGT